MSEDTEQAHRLRDVRDRLCMLLEDSELCDAHHVLEQIASTELWDEQVILHSKVGTHPAEELALKHLKLLLHCCWLQACFCYGTHACRCSRQRRPGCWLAEFRLHQGCTVRHVSAM